eukprot:794303-Rhodomonas_salina.2
MHVSVECVQSDQLWGVPGTHCVCALSRVCAHAHAHTRHTHTHTHTARATALNQTRREDGGTKKDGEKVRKGERERN